MKKIIMFLFCAVILTGIKAQSISVIKDTIIDVSSADIIASNVTPVTVLPALGAGYTYSLLDVMISYDFISLPVYTGGTTLRFYSTPPALPYTVPLATITNILNSTGDVVKKFGISPGSGTTNQYYDGGSVVFRVEPAASSGSGTIRLFITYQIIQL